MKIAPDLRDFVDEWIGVEGDDVSRSSRYRSVMRQLRTLLAVANAAKRVAIDYPELDDRLTRALARLQKVSAP